MPSEKQRSAARKNVRKAAIAAKKQRPIAHLPSRPGQRSVSKERRLRKRRAESAPHRDALGLLRGGYGYVLRWWTQNENRVTAVKENRVERDGGKEAVLWI